MMHKYIWRILFGIGLICLHAQLSAQTQIELLDSNSFVKDTSVQLFKTSFRGLSVVDDQTIWISGSKGTIARSIDSGKTFVFKRIVGYEKSDFRDIEAFDQKRAIIMSSGTPAYILSTVDGGETWTEVYKNLDSSYFLDAMDFWDDKRGVIVGDPIHSHFVILTTKDGGNNWKQVKNKNAPEAQKDESLYAASGTCVRFVKKNLVGFVTGGGNSRFILYNIKSNLVQSAELTMAKGEEGAGCFSFALSERYLFFAGGNYKSDTSKAINNFAYYKKSLFEYGNLAHSNEQFNGYKSSVEVIADKKGRKSYGYPKIIATGTSGTQIGNLICTFIDNKFNFTSYPETFNVVRKAKKGNSIYLAGSNGKIGRLKIEGL